MNEWTGSSELGVRLTKAQELIEQGKQRRALYELWEARALACGRADVFERRVRPRQKSGLVDLVAALEHDAKAAPSAGTNAESLDAPSAQPAGITSKKLFGIAHATRVLVVLICVWAVFVFVVGVLLTNLATHPILGGPPASLVVLC
jgi:hypothetical protein